MPPKLFYRKPTPGGEAKEERNGKDRKFVPWFIFTWVVSIVVLVLAAMAIVYSFEHAALAAKVQAVECDNKSIMEEKAADAQWKKDLKADIEWLVKIHRQRGVE